MLSKYLVVYRCKDSVHVSSERGVAKHNPVPFLLATRTREARGSRVECFQVAFSVVATEEFRVGPATGRG